MTEGKLHLLGCSCRLWLLSTLVWAASCHETGRGPVASTPLGKIRGHRMASRSGREFLAFSGIPYAKPPVGDLRFEPPRPVDPWHGIKEALVNGPWCMQFNTFDVNPEAIGDEDCLWLNVYTHNLKGRSPVLVHIHGGGYISGTAANTTGPQYLMDEDLVIVDLNYRLSFFGFLSFEDQEMPGNQGMKDQVLALRWIQENIASFGGDPSRVTLMGESAGGGSAYHHTVSPLSRGLLHGAISESGTSYAAWNLGPPGAARNTSSWVLSLVGCPNTTTKEAVACLRKVEAKELASQLNKMRTSWETSVYAYVGPTLEPSHPGSFLTGPISRWRHAPVPLLTGITSAEGLIHTLYFQFANASYEQLDRDFVTIIGPGSLQLIGKSSKPQEVARSIYQYYISDRKLTENDWFNLTMLYTDAFFAVGMIDGARKHTGKAFVYYFDYLGKYSLAGNANERNDSVVFGAFHTDETIYLWYNKDTSNLEGDDLKLSVKLVKLFSNFAKFGNPTTRGSDITWNEWTDNFDYLNIDKNGFKMKKNFIRDRYNFWKSIKYDDLLK